MDRPHWQESCDVEDRAGKPLWAHGELGGRVLGVVVPLGGAVVTVGNVVEACVRGGVEMPLEEVAG